MTAVSEWIGDVSICALKAPPYSSGVYISDVT